MNLLAHAYLSFDNDQITIGNLIGDFVKGRQFDKYKAEIAKGILLHRKIDFFTDKHPTFKQSVFKIDPKFGKYRYVIADIFYDHFLAKNWSQYHKTTLLDYTLSLYKMIDLNIEFLPQEYLRFYQYMKTENWLYNYQDLDLLDKTLYRMGKRSKYAKDLNQSMSCLIDNYSEFEDEFSSFFDEIIAFVKNEESVLI